jgi:integrase
MRSGDRISEGAIDVELWLRTLPLARAGRTKIRNLMSVLSNHARRHEFTGHNPITPVRQSAKRRTIPEVLLPSEINRLVPSLPNRERTLVLLVASRDLAKRCPSAASTLRGKIACD